MGAERHIYINEEAPLKASIPSKIILNGPGQSSQHYPNDGQAIHFNTEKSTDLGLRIKTKVTVGQSKRIKLLIIFNIFLCVVCLTASIYIYVSCRMDMQLLHLNFESLKKQLLMDQVRSDDFKRSALMASSTLPRVQPAESRFHDTFNSDTEIPINFANTFHRDLTLESNRKSDIKESQPTISNSALKNRDLVVIHFNGAAQEKNMALEPVIGPWQLDGQISSPNSAAYIDLQYNYFIVREEGLYLIYSQVMYLSQQPNCYFIWAAQAHATPRLLTSCSTGDDASRRPLEKSQISCATQNVVRLFKGDVINLAQREHSRTLWLRPGYSYVGFIKLSS